MVVARMVLPLRSILDNGTNIVLSSLLLGVYIQYNADR
jgi:hypothetical protein